MKTVHILTMIFSLGSFFLNLLFFFLFLDFSCLSKKEKVSAPIKKDAIWDYYAPDPYTFEQWKEDITPKKEIDKRWKAHLKKTGYKPREDKSLVDWESKYMCEIRKMVNADVVYCFIPDPVISDVFPIKEKRK